MNSPTDTEYFTPEDEEDDCVHGHKAGMYMESGQCHQYSCRVIAMQVEEI